MKLIGTIILLIVCVIIYKFNSLAGHKNKFPLIALFLLIIIISFIAAVRIKGSLESKIKLHKEHLLKEYFSVP